MKIGGLIKFTLIDFPGRPAAVVFTQGCNFRCRYCHNPELVYPHMFSEPVAMEEIYSFLKRRQGTLEGVVVSGGEPTLHEDLPSFMADLKAMGYATKLDTNGTRPDMLKSLLDAKLLDYIAMDIKAPLEKYSLITGVDFNPEVLKQSMDLIRQSGVDYEFRTTYDKEVLTDADISTITQRLDGKNYRVQECLPVAKEKATLKVMHKEI
ncbi:MAG: anaerobic ribonucleoside-triphosphate reductase activating protein [Elusimicrobia bacterium]|nr:anaerobic ribonucleoside-triphosphate reductase activating protein [Elusimicrobiota bacterium]MDD7578051.1 anaerobic ribonucleoside-triphosphate reductase activating protein [Elusimicrobiota bacterium]MDY6039383.1 anaerobic ribonucleoside-triphosphate reductase activating protein [Elusimicrobiaceae bacterium]